MMYQITLPTTAAALLLCLTLSAAAPTAAPEGVSFLSPRAQSSADLRSHAPALLKRDADAAATAVEAEQAEPAHPSRRAGRPHDSRADAHFTLGELDNNFLLDLELDLALLRASLGHGPHARPALAKRGELPPSEPAPAEPASPSAEQPLQPIRTTPLAIAGIRAHGCGGQLRQRVRDLLSAVSDVRQRTMLGAAVGVAALLSVLAAVELFLARRRRAASWMKAQSRDMKRVVRRGTKYRVESFPFNLETISEGKLLPDVVVTPSYTDCDDENEKTLAIASVTPAC